MEQPPRTSEECKHTYTELICTDTFSYHKCLNCGIACNKQLAPLSPNKENLRDWEKEFDENWANMFHLTSDEKIGSRGFIKHNANLVKEFIKQILSQREEELVKKLENNKMNYGFNVRIKYKKDSPFGDVEETRNNVTEIHYLYEGLLGEKDSVAFESDIHGTGGTIKQAYIKEFEAKLADKKEDNY